MACKITSWSGLTVTVWLHPLPFSCSLSSSHHGLSATPDTLTLVWGPLHGCSLYIGGSPSRSKCPVLLLSFGLWTLIETSTDIESGGQKGELSHPTKMKGSNRKKKHFLFFPGNGSANESVTTQNEKPPYFELSIPTTDPLFIVALPAAFSPSVKEFYSPCPVGFAHVPPWLQTLNHNSLLIPNKPILAGEITNGPFV